MDPNGNIYKGLEDEISIEDKARLDGYLHARAEMDEHTRLQLQAEMHRERDVVTTRHDMSCRDMSEQERGDLDWWGDAHREARRS